MGKITVLNLVASTAMGGAEKVILSIAGAIDRTAFVYCDCCGTEFPTVPHFRLENDLGQSLWVCPACGTPTGPYPPNPAFARAGLFP